MTTLYPATTTALTAFAALLGLVIGSFLNVVAYRVPAGISLLRESRCPACDAPVRWWQNIPVVSWLALCGRCGSCRATISPRYPLVEAGTAVLFAVIAWAATSSTSDWLGLPPGSVAGLPATIAVLAAFWSFAATSIVLALIDLDTQRLPSVIVLPGYAVGIVLLTLACLLGADWWALARAGIGMTALYALFLGLRLVRPDGMGGGDVRLAGLVGLHLGWLGWGPLAVGALAAFVFGGVFGLALLAGRRATRRTAIAFGPWILIGAWTGILAGAAIARAYGGLYGLA